MNRRIRPLAAAALLLVAAFLTGCSAHQPTGLKIGVAYDIGSPTDGTVENTSLNDAVKPGVDKVRKQLANRVATVRELWAAADETPDDKYDRLIILCESGYDPVIAIGPGYAGAVPASGPLAHAAKTCPKTRFAIVGDSRVSAINVANLTFADEQGGFLVGAAAALKTKSGRVGFVACRTASASAMEAGYRAGVATARPGTAVQVSYLPTDPQRCPALADRTAARTVADQLIASGVDVVFQDAGRCGTGVFEAARARDAMAVGVDIDQYKKADPALQNVIITSLLRNGDIAVYDFVKNVLTGSFAPGVTRYDLKSGGVDYAVSGGRIDHITSQLDGYRKQLIAGTILVPAGRA
jgi:basic membrane protein A